VFSVKSAYCEAAGSVTNPFYVNFWNNLVPSKVSTFAWKAVLDRIPTKTNLRRRGVMGVDDTTCVLCREGEETTNHILFHCKKTCLLWGNILSWLDIATAFHFNGRVQAILRLSSR
jgi:hypothetical protein